MAELGATRVWHSACARLAQARRVAAPPHLIGALRLAREGVTAIEMALLLPVFLMLLFGIVELSRALWTQTSLQFAVEAAARCAAVSPRLCTAPGGSTTNVPAYAASQVYGLSIPSSDFTYIQNAACGVSGNVSGAQVSAAYPIHSVVPQLVPLDVTLTAMSCHP